MSHHQPTSIQTPSSKTPSRKINPLPTRPNSPILIDADGNVVNRENIVTDEDSLSLLESFIGDQSFATAESGSGADTKDEDSDDDDDDTQDEQDARNPSPTPSEPGTGPPSNILRPLENASLMQDRLRLLWLDDGEEVAPQGGRDEGERRLTGVSEEGIVEGRLAMISEEGSVEGSEGTAIWRGEAKGGKGREGDVEMRNQDVRGGTGGKGKGKEREARVVAQFKGRAFV